MLNSSSAFPLRWIFLNWRQWLQGCFLVEETQVLILLASAGLESAQRSPCRLVRGLSQVSSPYSGAFCFQCCFLGLAGRFLLQILELENEKNKKTKSHISMNIYEGPLRLRKAHSFKFSFQQRKGKVLYSSLFIFG